MRRRKLSLSISADLPTILPNIVFVKSVVIIIILLFKNEKNSYGHNNTEGKQEAEEKSGGVGSGVDNNDDGKIYRPDNMPVLQYKK